MIFGRQTSLPTAWTALGVFVLLSAFALRHISDRFAYEASFEQMPILAFVVCYVAVSAIVTLCIPPLISAGKTQRQATLLLFIVLVGLAARVMQLGTSTLLEDDYYRYLWDGAVVSIGQSPFEFSPLDVMENRVSDPALLALSVEGAHILERVNHPEYRTIYPPVLQSVFAASHFAAPFSLDGWRIILLIFELGLAGVILALLKGLGTSPLWLSLYWWHPLVIKEVANSAHMEPVLMLPVFLGVWAIMHNRVLLSTSLLAIAAGIKLWPAIVAATLLRGYVTQPRLLLFGIGVMSVILALVLWPIWASGLDESSGFVAFSKIWRASSAVILVAQSITAMLPDMLSNNPLVPRLMLGSVLLGTLAIICARPARSPEAQVHRAFLVTASLYLLAPSQAPWYFLWVAPFLCLFPVRGLMLAGVTLPLHYLFFHLSFTEQTEVFRAIVVWLIWVPVWGLLLWDAWHAKGQRRAMEKATV